MSVTKRLADRSIQHRGTICDQNNEKESGQKRSRPVVAEREEHAHLLQGLKGIIYLLPEGGGGKDRPVNNYW